jgi:hypothetical protein
VAVDRWWFTIAVIVLYPSPGLRLQNRAASWTYHVAFGKPVFGTFGGIPRRVLQAEIECSRDLLIELNSDRSETDLKECALIHESFVKAHTHDAYLRIHEEHTGQLPPPQQWEEEWEQASNRTMAGTTYHRAVTENPKAFALVPGWLFRTRLVLPLGGVMLSVFLLGSLVVLETWTALPALLLIATLFGLIAAIFAGAVGSARPDDTVSLTFPVDFDASVDQLTRIPEAERTALKTRAASLSGASVQIADIRTGTRFKGAVARFVGRQLAAVLTIDLAVLVAQAALCLAAAALLTDRRATVATWYGRQTLTVAVLTAAALLAYHFWGFLLHRLGDIIAAPIGAALAAAIVPAGTYLVTGRFEFDATTVASTSTAAAVGLFGARIGEAARRQDRAGGPPAGT